MKIFAISDLHISSDEKKPMTIFGQQWKDHIEKIAKSWKYLVKQKDIVLIPGDISWAMKIEQAAEDLKQIASLPGKKIIIKGNHDYWWGGIRKLREKLPPDFIAIQNDSYGAGEFVFAGTRGWIMPGALGFEQKDEKIFNRELMRMEMSLEDARIRYPDNRLIVLTHYPPISEQQTRSPWENLFQKYRVERVVYGHLHDKGIETAFLGIREGIEYHLVSCDFLNFSLLEIASSAS